MVIIICLKGFLKYLHFRIEPFPILVEININLWLTGLEMLHSEETQSLCPPNRKVCKDEFIAVQFEILVVSDSC